jgi:large subunit ribosomal protein L32
MGGFEEFEIATKSTKNTNFAIFAPFVANNFRGFIMPNPKRRHSKSRTRQRRAHDALKVPQFYIDKDTGEAKKPHHVDAETGTYKGRQNLDVKDSE